MGVPETVALQVRCRPHVKAAMTVAHDYAICKKKLLPPLCEPAEVHGLASHFSGKCRVAGEQALASKKPNIMTLCKCLLEVPESVMSTFTCRAHPGLTATLWTDYEACVAAHPPAGEEETETKSDVPVCKTLQVLPALGKMSAGCQKWAARKLAKNELADGDPQLCKCFLEVPETMASKLTCRPHYKAEVTIADDYADCKEKMLPPMCETTKVHGLASHFSSDCRVAGAEALTKETPDIKTLCKCLLEVPKSVMSTFTCRAHPGLTATLMTDYEACKVEHPELSD